MYNKNNTILEDTSVNVIKQIASKYFKTDIKATTSDKMKYIQNNMTDHAFLRSTYLYNNSSGFLVYGIDTTGTFIMKDIKDIAKEKTWYLGLYDSDSGNKIPIGSTISTISNKLTKNLDNGFKFQYNEFKLPSGVLKDNDSSIFNTFSLSTVDDDNKKAPRNGIVFNTGELHPTFYESKIKNTRMIQNITSVGVSVSFFDTFKPIKILDNVFLSFVKSTTDESEEYISGIYFVSSVTRTVDENKRITTTLILNREKWNDEF